MTPEIAAVLKSYVYLYTDPRDGKPFYIGKGQGDRLFAHLDDPAETEKTNKISDIRKSGLEPRIDILRYGLTDTEAALIEASAIDYLQLTSSDYRSSPIALQVIMKNHLDELDYRKL